jgi:hypothetical protein
MAYPDQQGVSELDSSELSGTRRCGEGLELFWVDRSRGRVSSAWLQTLQ